MSEEQVNAEISRQILELRAQGKSLPDAVDAVLGPGTYAEVVKRVYETIKKGVQ